MSKLTLIILSSPHVITQSCLLGWENAKSFTPPTWASIYIRHLVIVNMTTQKPYNKKRWNFGNFKPSIIYLQVLSNIITPLIRIYLNNVPWICNTWNWTIKDQQYDQFFRSTRNNYSDYITLTVEYSVIIILPNKEPSGLQITRFTETPGSLTKAA